MRAPAWILTLRAGIEEDFTDNVYFTSTNPKQDLLTKPSAGFQLTADTPRLSGLLSYDATYIKHIQATEQDRFSQDGFGTGHLTVVPNLAFMDLHFSADDVSGSVVSAANPVQSSNSLQTYVLTVSPYAHMEFGGIGYGELRYAGSGVWFGGHTVSPSSPSSAVGPISDSVQQQIHAELAMPGTVVNWLQSDLMANAEQVDSSKTLGVFNKYFSAIINEAAVTRSLSLVGAVGYEKLSDKKLPFTMGEDATWSAGFRWRPNGDSSVLLTYGRYDLATDFAGEAQFRLTPFTVLYAAYTNSTATSQQSIAANGGSSILMNNSISNLLNSSQGVAGVTFQQNPYIATLNKTFVDEQTIAAYAAENSSQVSLSTGLPLADLDNFQPLQNGLFRTKFARAVLYHELQNFSLSLEGFHISRLSLATPALAPVQSDGGTFTVSRPFSDQLSALAAFTYEKINTDADGSFNVRALVNYKISRQINTAIEYDFIRNGPNSATENVLTLRLVLTRT